MSEVQIPVTEELNITHQHVGVGVGASEVGVIKRKKHHTTKPLAARMRQEQKLRLRTRGRNLQ
jgi:hypothetical protein